MTLTAQQAALHGLHGAFVAYWRERVEQPDAFVSDLGAVPETAEELAKLLETARAGLGSERWGAVDVPGATVDVLAERAFAVNALEEAIAALPPASPWAILAAARAVGRGAPLALFDATLAQHAVIRDADEADGVAHQALMVDRNIDRFGGDAEKRINAMAEALVQGASPIGLLQQIARAADTEGRCVLALDAIEAALRLGERDAPEFRKGLLQTRGLVQLSFFDLDGCAATCAEIEALAPGEAALIEAYRRGLGQPFEMWVRPAKGPFEPPAIELEGITERIDAVVERLIPIRRALVKRLGERCPIPALDALSSVEVEPSEIAGGGVPDLVLQARRAWLALCLLLSACGQTELLRPTELRTPTYDLEMLHAAMRQRRNLLGVLEEAETLGELDDEYREALAGARWGGPNGTSILALPPPLAGIWASEVDEALGTLTFLLDLDEDAEEPESIGELPTPIVLSLADGTARFPQIAQLEMHPGLQADAVVVYDGDVDAPTGELDDLVPAHLRADGGVVVVVTGSLRLRGEGGWAGFDREVNALIVKGDLHADILEVCGMAELEIEGDLRARHIYVHHGDDGGYLNVGKDLRAESMLSTTYFNVKVGGDIHVERLVVDGTYAGHFAERVPHVVTEDDEAPIWERLKAGEPIDEDPAPSIETSTVNDLPALAPEVTPTHTASFGAGKALAPLAPLRWPLHVARIGDDVVLAGNLGTSGNVVRSSDGASFRPLFEHGTSGLRQVYGVNPATLLAVGEYGTVLKLSQMSGGIQVSTLPPPSRGCLFGVWVDRGEILVSGDDGVFAWRGGRWAQILDTRGLCRLFPTARGVVAIGDADDVGAQIWLREAGDGWKRIALPDARFDAYGFCAVDDVAVVSGRGGALWRLSLSGAFTPVSVRDPAMGSDLYALLALGERIHVFGAGVVGVSTDGGKTFTMEAVPGQWWGGCVLPDGRQVRAGCGCLAIDDGPFPQPTALDKEPIDPAQT